MLLVARRGAVGCALAGGLVTGVEGEVEVLGPQVDGGGVLGVGAQALELGVGEGVEGAEELAARGSIVEGVAGQLVGVEVGQARGGAAPW